MGALSLPPSGCVYLDANCVVYRVEQIEPFVSLLRPVFEAAKAGVIELATSELSLMECLVKPVRTGDHEVERLFRTVLTGSREMRLIPISLAVLERATRLRAEHDLKTPDAIHAATALEAHCVTFLSNDSEFERVPELQAQVLSRALP